MPKKNRQHHRESAKNTPGNPPKEINFTKIDFFKMKLERFDTH